MRFDHIGRGLHPRTPGAKKRFIKINGIPETPGSIRNNNPFRFSYLRWRRNLEIKRSKFESIKNILRIINDSMLL